ncbi:MAG: hypothetical protein IKN07_13765, partial [Lachnospiraceae bacterium]|nr:hypothetical protein [Lachnospiraceae bacterium]
MFQILKVDILIDLFILHTTTVQYLIDHGCLDGLLYHLNLHKTITCTKEIHPIAFDQIVRDILAHIKCDFLRHRCNPVDKRIRFHRPAIGLFQRLQDLLFIFFLHLPQIGRTTLRKQFDRIRHIKDILQFPAVQILIDQRDTLRSPFDPALHLLIPVIHR